MGLPKAATEVLQPTLPTAQIRRRTKKEKSVNSNGGHFLSTRHVSHGAAVFCEVGSHCSPVRQTLYLPYFMHGASASYIDWASNLPKVPSSEEANWVQMAVSLDLSVTCRHCESSDLLDL